jgi:hypothetical protein
MVNNFLNNFFKENKIIIQMDYKKIVMIYSKTSKKLKVQRLNKLIENFQTIIKIPIK